MIRQPRLDRRDLAIGQQASRSAAAPDRRRSFRSGDFVRKAQSSMPTTVRGSVGSAIRRRTTRSSVSLLTGSISRLAKLAAGLPPSANPRWWTMHSSRAVRRDRSGRTSSPNRSAKIRRRQCGTSQTKRRVITRRRISLPAQGKSATCLSYRLWIRRDLAPHNGHRPTAASDRTARIIESMNHLRSQ